MSLARMKNKDRGPRAEENYQRDEVGLKMDAFDYQRSVESTKQA